MNLIIGEAFEAKIIGIKNFGVFVRLNTGEIGMVHISQISNDYIQDINTAVRLDDIVNVKLIGITENSKLSFSIKQALPINNSKVRTYQNKGIIWQPRQRDFVEEQSFEDMLLKFKTLSDEKLSEYKKSKDIKKGSGTRRR